LVGDHASMLADVVGILTREESNCHVGGSSLPSILGGVLDIPAVVRTHVIDEVVVVSTLSQLELEQVSRWCSKRGILMRILIELPRPVLGVWNGSSM
jgi:hypothetical protein